MSRTMRVIRSPLAICTAPPRSICPECGTAWARAGRRHAMQPLPLGLLNSWQKELTWWSSSPLQYQKASTYPWGVFGINQDGAPTPHEKAERSPIHEWRYLRPSNNPSATYPAGGVSDSGLICSTLTGTQSPQRSGRSKPTATGGPSR